jgi:hypothetical protein
MNHLLFNNSTPDPNKAPHPPLPDRRTLPDPDHARRPLGFHISVTGNPQFHAHRLQNQPEFQCDRCGGPVVRMPGRVATNQLPYVMYCNASDIPSGGWQTNEERELFLEGMPVA